MLNKLRNALVAALAAVVVIAPSATAVRAQGDTCFPGLDADTCTLLTEAGANLATTTKFAMDYTLVVKTGGLPEAQTVDISVTGSGAIDLTGASAMTSMAMGAPADPAVIGELLKSLKLTQVIDAVIKAGGTEQKGKFEARIVDGTLFFVSDPATAGKWQKVDLQKAIAAGQSQMGGMTGAGGTGNVNPLNDPATTAAVTALTSDPKFLQLFADTSKYLVVETTDGPEVAGAATKKIQIGLNLKGLLEILTSDDALPTLKALLETQGTKLEDAEFKQQVALIKSQLAAFAPTFEATTIAAYWLVDPAAKTFSGFGLTIATKLDPNAAALVNPTATGEVTVNIDFLVTISKVGEDVAVEPVADAVEIPIPEAAPAPLNPSPTP